MVWLLHMSKTSGGIFGRFRQLCIVYVNRWSVYCISQVSHYRRMYYSAILRSMSVGIATVFEDSFQSEHEIFCGLHHLPYREDGLDYGKLTKWVCLGSDFCYYHMR